MSRLENRKGAKEMNGEQERKTTQGYHCGIIKHQEVSRQCLLRIAALEIRLLLDF